MSPNYRMIEVEARTIDDMVLELLSYNTRGEMVSTEFNEKIFYSDTVTLDGAYLALTGKTKSEFEEYRKVEEQRIENEMSNPNHPFHSLLHKNSDN